MRRVVADAAVLRHATPAVLDELRGGGATLERVQRRLDAYLDVKRQAFPRFFFLSNDEMLQILAQARATRTPRAAPCPRPASPHPVPIPGAPPSSGATAPAQVLRRSAAPRLRPGRRLGRRARAPFS